MDTIAFALITVLAWGIWLAPSNGIPYASVRVRGFYVGAANLLVAVLVALVAGIEGMTWGVAAWSALGGLIWSASGFFAFYASALLGIARAMGIWAPLNVAFSFFWGIVLFGELRHTSMQQWLVVALAVLLSLAGLHYILLSGRRGESDRVAVRTKGPLLAALLAGGLWGSYFVPLQLSGAPVWTSVLPMSVGIFLGNALGVLLARDEIRLSSKSEYARSCLSGLLWGLGNYGSLKLMESIGTGQGFTIAQLCVVVNALVGIYWLKQPRPGTSAARTALAGVVLATLGGALLGAATFRLFSNRRKGVQALTLLTCVFGQDARKSKRDACAPPNIRIV